MTIALVLVGAVAVLALLFAVAALVRAPGPSLRGKTVILHTRRPDDRTVRGVVHGAYADRYTLRDATLVMPGGREQALGGLEHVPMANVSLIQEVLPSE